MTPDKKNPPEGGLNASSTEEVEEEGATYLRVR
jgi:hypothetical protein